MKINDEINRFILEGRIIDEIRPFGSFPKYLQELQHRVIQAHAELDDDMVVRFLSQIRYEAGDVLSNEAWQKINLLVQQFLGAIPYMSKVSIIKSFGDVSDDLENALVKVNTYRNEFSHPKVSFLLGKYDAKNSKGKIELRNLTRAVKRAKDLFLEHTEKSEACKFYVRKQIEILETKSK